MDLIKQNKFIGWVIAVLVVLNISTITIIWMQSGKKEPYIVNEQGNPTQGSVRLIQREIGMSDDQTNKFLEMRKELQEKMRKTNDELDNLKLGLVEEIFKPVSDIKRVDSMVGIIGNLQSKVEKMRFEHFRSLEQICNEEQREKLQPVLKEVFGKKPPNDRPDIKPQEDRKDNPDRVREDVGEKRASPPSDRPAPPTQEEKLNKYADKLSLTPEQIKKLDNIFSTTRTKEETFKSKFKPNQSEFELEKSKLRKEEDQKVFLILSWEQKVEFEKMIKNRSENNPSNEPPNDNSEMKKQNDSEKNVEVDQRRLPPSDDRNAPPTKEERLKRLSERLSLNPEQITKVDNILNFSREKENKFKSNKPGRSEFEKEKKIIRDEEDESILKILNQDQKIEFEKMLKKRGKQ